jgi:hypothetical protein
MCFRLLKKLDLIMVIFKSKSKDWTRSVQYLITHAGLYVSKLSDLIGSFSAAPRGPREELWQDFFLDPSQWWEHRSEKEHQSCQSSHVNGVIGLIGVNRVAHS